MLPISFALFCGVSSAQHLWWNLEGQRDATCLYGEITVLVTHPAVYYCGANWHPGEPAGGYCGIQDNSMDERRTIFSVWDTSPELHPDVTEVDPKTLYQRFGGEGEGSHTHMIWPWKAGETFQYFVRKQPGGAPNTTDTRYYIYDRAAGKWLHSATITSPVGGERSVETIGGSMNSFLENFEGTGREIPKLALYRLWLGVSLDSMKCLTLARGDGIWGKLGDAYFLAEGRTASLDSLFSSLEKEFGKPEFGVKREYMGHISDRSLAPSLIKELQNLPRAPGVRKDPER